jgi:hypothetical protein
MVAGDRHYKFKLSAWHQTGEQWHFDIQSLHTWEEHKESRLFFPFWALPWLRQQMVKILAEHDGSERIKEMPKIPEWATQGFSKFKNFIRIRILPLLINQLHQKLNMKSSSLTWSKNR